MEGLEATTIRLSELERTTRIDSEYFQSWFRQSASLLSKFESRAVATLVKVADGNHFTISEDFVDEGIPYYRGQDVTGRFFVDQATPNFITQEAFDRPYMKRSHLKKGDVLLSIIGTIGELSLVDSTQLATCSCKLAILRPHSIEAEFLATFLQCRHGNHQIRRLMRGAVQQGFLLEDVDQLVVPNFSDGFRQSVVRTVRAARATQAAAQASTAEAETSLLAALGLAGWSPPEPLSYTARAADALVAARLDAQFYAPRIRALLNLLGRNGRTVSDLAKPRRDRFSAKKCDAFHYIEIGDVEGGGGVGSTLLDSADAPSRATWHVRKGDVLTSTVRPIRRLSAIVAAEQDRYVASSGFAVLQPTGVTSEVLMTFLRLPVICELMDLYASASMYPAISEADILGLPVPLVSAEIADAVSQAVQSAFAARARSRSLLTAAKRAVEIAIEESEEAALAYLATAGGERNG